jgi:ribonuclease HI
MTDKHILQWNCRGLKANLPELDILLQTFSPVAICLQETLQNENKPINLRKYSHYYKNNLTTDGRPRGGVSIFIKRNIPHSQILLNTTLQATAVKISLHRPITLCSIYLPPSINIDIADLDAIVSQLPSPILFLGDFNAHSPLWGCNALDSRGKICEDLINRHNLCFLNGKTPTYLHSATGSRTAIDLSICDHSLMLDMSWSVHDDLCGSDHFPIIIKNNKPAIYPSVAKWKLEKADWITFRSLCEQQLDNKYIKNIDAFTTELITIAEKTIPKTNPNSSHTKKPWFDDNCKAAISNRKSSLKLFTKHPTTNNLDSFRMTRAKARRTIREAKKQSWQNFVSGLNSRITVKKAWDMVRKISGKGTQTSVNHLISNNILVTDLKDISNTLAETFSCNSSTNHYTPEFQQCKKTQEKTPVNFKSKNIEAYNMPFSKTELQDAINNSSDTSPGPDNIHYQFIKHLPENSIQLLLHLLNSIWTSGRFPVQWQQGIVIPIPKPNKEHTDPNSYRPIALTSCLCKTMERMVNDRLVYYLESNRVISNLQSGFRKQRCTTDQLVRLETWVREGLANREHVVAVLFDLEKAYDTTWKYGILLDLFKAGLRGYLPIFISKFLENRLFRVRIGSTLSDQFSQETGVPQGSILSVTLFNLKINSIVDCIKPGIDSSLYVDDFLACARSQQMRSIERQLQLCLNNLQKWSDENGFRFSTAKTVCIHFCNKRLIHPEPVLLLHNQPIPIVAEAKFLGVTFDKKLSFIPHLQNLRTKCTKSLNLLKVVSHKDWGGNSQTLLKLYRTLIRSKLDYGSIVYGSARKSYLQMLDPIQNLSLRLCLGAFRTSPIESLQVEANEPPLSSRRNKLAVHYAIKVKSNPTNPTYQTIFDPQYTTLFENRPKTIPPISSRIQNILDNINLDLTVVSTYQLPTINPWTLKLPKVHFTLHSEKKCLISPDLLRAQFYSYLSGILNSFHIYTDGSKDTNGVAAAAVSRTTQLSCRLPTEASIHSAETQAISLALKIVEFTDHDSFYVFSDSMSCLQAICNHKFEKAGILQILEKCHALQLEGKIVQFCWVPSHVGIKGNEKADCAAKAALQLPLSVDTQIPYTDLKHTINTYFTRIWQNHWNQTQFNKLQMIKPNISETKLQNVTVRRDEVVLHRARIGHTFLTHSYLLKQENSPDCSACHSLLTVQHILLDCPNYHTVRVKYFTSRNLHDLFGTVRPICILDFLKEIDIYNAF